ncbi:hypothetical protein NMY22_g8862 [Coprinellus aureogranulatus]|nr:hypothetical protein NMY22_g8862 [Coprinellus aureogranulatus]
MGRPRLYNTREEQLEAGRKRSQRYYQKNSAKICQARKKKYAATNNTATATTSTSKKVPNSRLSHLMEEEKKLQNRKKSQRSYARRKSFAPRPRQTTKPAYTANSPQTSGVNAVGSTKPNAMIWAQRLSHIRRDFSNALRHQNVEDFVDKTAMAYIETGFASVLDSAARPFNALHDRLQSYQDEMLCLSGTGAQLSEAYKLSGEIMDVVRKLEDLWESGTLRGHERFTEWYTDLREGRIAHQFLV